MGGPSEFDVLMAQTKKQPVSFNFIADFVDDFWEGLGLASRIFRFQKLANPRRLG
jgi:hypothetical protein